MKRTSRLFLAAVGLAAFSSSAYIAARPAEDLHAAAAKRGAYYTGDYPNLFRTILGQPEQAVRARIDSAFRQLFYGDDSTQRLYYPVGDDQAYVWDVANNDVRTEGMSYGMMIAVQLGRKEEFDRMWKWATTHMENREGPHRGYFAWHCRTDGQKLSQGAASDGEEWFVTALFLASARWGDKGLLNYGAEARRILFTMLHKDEEPGRGNVTNMFDPAHRLVAFVPSHPGNGFTDPSYQLPHFYELWARWADHDRQFWCEAASASRALLRRAAHPVTGLSPDYSAFDGRPVGGVDSSHADFRFDAWRVAMNVAVDWVWFRKDPWQVAQSDRLLQFFHRQGVRSHGNQFSLDGRQLGKDHSAGLVAMNAVAALAATHPRRRDFVEELWRTPVPSGHYRYYDGMLYLLALLQVGGEFRVVHPAGGPVDACLEENRNDD